MNDVERAAEPGIDTEADRSRGELQGDFGQIHIETVCGQIEIQILVLARVRVIVVKAIVAVESATNPKGPEFTFTEIEALRIFIGRIRRLINALS